jgi:hypothetical protein
MLRLPLASLVAVTLCLLLMPTSPTQAQDAIQTGAIVVDPPTICCLGFEVPILSGDRNYNAQAHVAYRQQGTTAWRAGLPLLRVRPETTSTEDPPSGYGLPFPAEGFAGSIFGLAPDTAYEVRITITDPDGGGSEQTVTARTRAAPVGTPASPRQIPVANRAQLTAALSNAMPGDVITLAAGTYTGSLAISRSGTAPNPIIIRGSSRSGVIIDATGSTYGLSIGGSNVFVENLTVRGSEWGAGISNTEGTVIRGSRFTSINRGIDGSSGTNRNFYICDNVLEGRLVWPNVSSATFGVEGITVGGQGHVVCHNTISGFGDALGLSHLTGIPSIAIDFHNNDVLWTGDDGIETDYSTRNIRVFENRITNCGMGVSLQPVWGGPNYIFRNVIANAAHAPFKLNNEPSGFYIFNNTSLRTVGDGNYGIYAWPQIGYVTGGHWAYAANFQFKNNLVIGVGAPPLFTTAIMLGEIDYNGWTPDGAFVFDNTSWNSFADLQSRSPYEAHGRILNSPTFQTPFSFPANYTTFWSPKDVTLAATSNAVDAGLVIPNITDGFVGSAPDLGAWERGALIPIYGARSDTIAPSAPAGLTLQ